MNSVSGAPRAAEVGSAKGPAGAPAGAPAPAHALEVPSGVCTAGSRQILTESTQKDQEKQHVEPGLLFGHLLPEKEGVAVLAALRA